MYLSTACGGELTATTSYQQLSSPQTQRNQNCYWRITVGLESEFTFYGKHKRLLIDIY